MVESPLGLRFSRKVIEEVEVNREFLNELQVAMMQMLIENKDTLTTAYLKYKKITIKMLRLDQFKKNCSVYLNQKCLGNQQ